MPRGSYILVLEDDSATGAMVADVLSEIGYTVHAVLDASQARSALEIRFPALLLCDLHLANTSGLALARELRGAGYDGPIVLMTADTAAVQQFDLSPITYWLRKPFELDELLSCVATYAGAPPSTGT
jgi:DNA-binding response OmpR family regulator